MTTTQQLLKDYDGASAAEWMALRTQADQLGRKDLVELCIAKAEEAYILEDE